MPSPHQIPGKNQINRQITNKIEEEKKQKGLALSACEKTKIRKRALRLLL
jgi:hypothetical protein